MRLISIRRTPWPLDLPSPLRAKRPSAKGYQVRAVRDREAWNGPRRRSGGCGVLPWSSSWRLRHMMYLVAAMAILFWLGFWPSTRDDRLAVRHGGLVFLFAAVMGGGVILARGRATRQDSLSVGTGDRGGTRDAAGARDRSRSPISTGACRTGGSWTWPPSSTGEPAFPRRSSGHASWSRATRSCWPGSARPQAGCRGRCGWPPRRRSNQLPIWTAITARLSYILGLLLAMQIITGFIMYFIMPKFEAIFKDFNVSLPQVTISGHRVCRIS